MLIISMKKSKMGIKDVIRIDKGWFVGETTWEDPPSYRDKRHNAIQQLATYQLYIWWKIGIQLQ